MIDKDKTNGKGTAGGSRESGSGSSGDTAGIKYTTGRVEFGSGNPGTSPGTSDVVGQNDSIREENRELLHRGAGNEQSGVDDTSGGGTGNSNDNGATGSGKRKPGRPKGSRNKTSGSTAGAVQATVDGDSPAPKKRTPTRRSTKITPVQVETGVVKVFGLAAMMRGPLWKVDKKEVESWSEEAAELLNKIPTSAFDRAMHISTVVAVVAGMGGIVVPRVMAESMIAKQKVEAKRAQDDAAIEESEGVETVHTSASHDTDTYEQETPQKPNPFDAMQEGF